MDLQTQPRHLLGAVTTTQRPACGLDRPLRHPPSVGALHSGRLPPALPLGPDTKTRPSVRVTQKCPPRAREGSRCVGYIILGEDCVFQQSRLAFFHALAGLGLSLLIQ